MAVDSQRVGWSGWLTFLIIVPLGTGTGNHTIRFRLYCVQRIDSFFQYKSYDDGYVKIFLDRLRLDLNVMISMAKMSRDFSTPQCIVAIHSSYYRIDFVVLLLRLYFRSHKHGAAVTHT
jgi:hypothetical protein